MNGGQREITSATAVVTLAISDLGSFGPGSICEQAKEAAANRLIGLGIGADQIRHIKVLDISTERSKSCS